MNAESEMIASLRKAQSDEGAFLSVCHWGDRRYSDWNGFTTAQTLRTLRTIPDSAELDGIRRRALDFIQKCEDSNRPGAFSFWPRAMRPDWIRVSPPVDADDTAICATLLGQYGRLDRTALRHIVCTVLLPHRLQSVDALAPPWLHPGVFVTWLEPNERMNVVDCCVNTNVVALLAYAGLDHLPGFRESCSLIEDGLHWAGDSWARARTLVPFYPHPIELRYAIEYAVECGVEALRPCLALLRKLWWASEKQPGFAFSERAVCSSAYGEIVWSSSVLQSMRKIVR